MPAPFFLLLLYGPFGGPLFLQVAAGYESLNLNLKPGLLENKKEKKALLKVPLETVKSVQMMFYCSDEK